MRTWRARVRQRRAGLAAAFAVTVCGLVLIYIADDVLGAATPSLALVAYVGVFVVAAGLLYGASTLLILE
ncbi:MAG TPA: hypothetical protein VEG65_03015 [Candidatus Bathyarchaeia archaeon]|nr:hypothetical protein [Candidatus Bathyarchaeia archaeon]